MALPSIKNSVGMAVTAVADAGVGTLTVGAALSGGYQTAATAYGADANIDIRVEEDNTWEVCRDCTYTHSGTTVTRGTQEEGSSGTSTRVAFTTAAKVYVIEPAARIERAVRNALSITPGGRLTLESGVPVSTTDQTAKTTIYYTPYVHNVVALWDGADWVPTLFAEKSLALGTLTAALCYDVFGYLSAGELALEMLAWTDATTRSTGVSLQDGRYCKTGDKSRLLLGTFYTTSTTTTEDSVTKRLLGNLYNKVNKRFYYSSGAASHTYNSFTYRNWNNSTDSCLSCCAPIYGTRFVGTAVCNTDNVSGWLRFASVELSSYKTVGSAVGACAGPRSMDAGFNQMCATERASATCTFEWLLLIGGVDI